VLRFALLGTVVLLVAAGCGGSSTKTYAAPSTQTCLVKKGATVGGPLDFVASTAGGGAFIAHLSDGNYATLVFGTSDDNAAQLVREYQAFAFPNVKQNLPDVLKRYNNAVMLWHMHPANGDLSLVAACLK
jgi:hypothetical protein